MPKWIAHSIHSYSFIGVRVIPLAHKKFKDKNDSLCDSMQELSVSSFFATILHLLFFELNLMECRLSCGACCVAPSITSAIPGMPNGKPAGVRCIQLNEQDLCKLFGQPSRPKVCYQFKACPIICGKTDQEALDNLIELEAIT